MPNGRWHPTPCAGRTARAPGCRSSPTYSLVSVGAVLRSIGADRPEFTRSAKSASVRPSERMYARRSLEPDLVACALLLEAELLESVRAHTLVLSASSACTRPCCSRRRGRRVVAHEAHELRGRPLGANPRDQRRRAWRQRHGGTRCVPLPTGLRLARAAGIDDDASTPRRTRSLGPGSGTEWPFCAQGCPRGRDLRHRSVRATEPHDTSATSRRTRQTLTSQRCSRNSRAASVLLPLARRPQGKKSILHACKGLYCT